MIKKFRKTFISYGLALAAITSTLSVFPAYADDSLQPITETQPSQMVPAANTNVPSTEGTTRVLGTLPAGDATTPSSMMPGPAGVAAQVPLVAPMEPSMASWEDVLPPQKSGDVTYVTGGIGDEERAALGEAKKNFNVYIISSSKDGAFIGDTRIVIRTSKGDELLNTAAGPLLYVKLPAGTYTVEGSKEGRTKEEKIRISTKGASNVNFNW